MNIDLDTILAAIKPKPLALKIDGRDYVVRRLRIADALQLDQLSKMPDDKYRQFVSSLFEGEAPECIKRIGDETLTEDARAENNLHVLIVCDAIARAYIQEESPAKKLNAALLMMKAQIEAAHPSTPGTALS